MYFPTCIQCQCSSHKKSMKAWKDILLAGLFLCRFTELTKLTWLEDEQSWLIGRNWQNRYNWQNRHNRQNRQSKIDKIDKIDIIDKITTSTKLIKSTIVNELEGIYKIPSTYPANTSWYFTEENVFTCSRWDLQSRPSTLTVTLSFGATLSTSKFQASESVVEARISEGLAISKSATAAFPGKTAWK